MFAGNTPMKRFTICLAPLLTAMLALVALGPGCNAAAEDQSTASATKAQEKIAQTQKLLADTIVDTRSFPDVMTLAQFLAAMQGKSPEDKKISIKIDQEAFGKQLEQVAGASIKPLHAKN